METRSHLKELPNLRKGCFVLLSVFEYVFSQTVDCIYFVHIRFTCFFLTFFQFQLLLYQLLPSTKNLISPFVDIQNRYFF